jgi:hypothetical protein
MRRAAVIIGISAHRGEQRSLTKAARPLVNEFRSAVRSILAQARQAAEQNRGAQSSTGNSSSRGSGRNESGG